MKAIYAIEVSRWGTSYNDNRLKDKYFSSFDVKFNDADELHRLTVTTTADGKQALSYSLDTEPELQCKESSWINALLQAANKGQYCAALPKEFELHEEGNEYYYALTQASKQQIQQTHEESIRMLTERYPEGFTTSVPDTSPGLKMADNKPIILDNPLLNTLLQEQLFENNDNLVELVKQHNQYVALYMQGVKTDEQIRLMLTDKETVEQFYTDEEQSNILARCIAIQQQLDKINLGQEFAVLKDSYWKNLVKKMDLDTVLASSISAASASLCFAFLPFFCSAGPIVMFSIFAALFTALFVGIIVHSLYEAYMDKLRAGGDYLTTVSELGFTVSETETTEPFVGNKYSFFADKKQELESEISLMGTATVNAYQ